MSSQEFYPLGLSKFRRRRPPSRTRRTDSPAAPVHVSISAAPNTPRTMESPINITTSPGIELAQNSLESGRMREWPVANCHVRKGRCSCRDSGGRRFGKYRQMAAFLRFDAIRLPEFGSQRRNDMNRRYTSVLELA